MWKSKAYRPGFLLILVVTDGIGNGRMVIAADDVLARQNYQLFELRRKRIMEQRLQHLVQRLTVIGYRPHEISNIVKSTAGSNVEMVGQLERYEQLGLQYLHNYSQ